MFLLLLLYCSAASAARNIRYTLYDDSLCSGEVVGYRFKTGGDNTCNHGQSLTCSFDFTISDLTCPGRSCTNCVYQGIYSSQDKCDFGQYVDCLNNPPLPPGEAWHVRKTYSSHHCYSGDLYLTEYLPVGQCTKFMNGYLRSVCNDQTSVAELCEDPNCQVNCSPFLPTLNANGGDCLNHPSYISTSVECYVAPEQTTTSAPLPTNDVPSQQPTPSSQPTTLPVNTPTTEQPTPTLTPTALPTNTPTPTPTPTSDPQDVDSQPLSGGAVAGIAAAVILTVAVVLISGTAVYYIKDKAVFKKSSFNTELKE